MLPLLQGLLQLIAILVYHQERQGNSQEHQVDHLFKGDQLDCNSHNHLSHWEENYQILFRIAKVNQLPMMDKNLLVGSMMDLNRMDKVSSKNKRNGSNNRNSKRYRINVLMELKSRSNSSKYWLQMLIIIKILQLMGLMLISQTRVLLN